MEFEFRGRAPSISALPPPAHLLAKSSPDPEVPLTHIRHPCNDRAPSGDAMSRLLNKELSGSMLENALSSLLWLLVAVLLGAVAVAIVQAGLELWSCVRAIAHHRSPAGPLKEVMISALTVLAFVEVFRTAMAYFIEGRVKVTYLVDTVLVALLTEILSFWHREMEPQRILLVIALLLALFFVRILAIRYSPNRRSLSEGL